MASFLQECGSEAHLLDDVIPPTQPDDVIPPSQPDDVIPPSQPDDVIPPTQPDNDEETPQPSPKKTPEAKLGGDGKSAVSPTVQELMDTQVGVVKKTLANAYRFILKKIGTRDKTPTTKL